jgi:hypothetical protein
VVRIEFRIGGRTVRPRQIRNRLARVVLETIERSIHDRLRSSACEEHAMPLTVLASGPSVDQLSFELAGCCETAIGEAKRRLESSPAVDA